MTDRAVARARPAHEQERRPVAAGRIRCVVHERRDGVGLPVRAAECRRPLVHALIVPQRVVVSPGPPAPPCPPPPPPPHPVHTLPVSRPHHGRSRLIPWRTRGA